jgi:hypothetical protein
MKKLMIASLIATTAIVSSVLCAADFKPLVTGCYFGTPHKGVVSPMQNDFGLAIEVIYVVYKTHNNTIDVKEYRIRRYRGSAVLKNPFFNPAKGFHGIVPSRGDKTERPAIIQQFAEFIRNHFSAQSETNHGNRMVKLFFYAEADELAEYNKGFVEHVKGYFKKPKPKKEHPLLAALRDMQKTKITVGESDAPFNSTNVFVAQNVTLEDLKAINECITLVG